jgi:hypothetical protein
VTGSCRTATASTTPRASRCTSRATPPARGCSSSTTARRLPAGRLPEQHLDELIGRTTTGRIDLAPSVTARVPLADAADAVAQLEKKIGDPIRIVLVP